MHQIYKAILCVGLPIVLSACATKPAVDVSPSANNLRVIFYTGFFGQSGELCTSPVPDRGNAPVCKAALDKISGISSIVFRGWTGTRSVCLRTAKNIDVLCVVGDFSNGNIQDRMIGYLRNPHGNPELLKPLKVTFWNIELMKDVTKIVTFKSDQPVSG